MTDAGSPREVGFSHDRAYSVDAQKAGSNRSGGAGAAIGIDLGGTRIKWAVIEGETVSGSGKLATPQTGVAAVLEALRELGRDRLVTAAGLAIPGPVPRRGERLFLPNVPGDWEAVDLHAELGDALPGLVLLNDAIAFGEGELRAAAQRYADVVFFTLGTGVGGAIAIGGKIYLGSLGRAGELGHMTVDPGGALCVCGNRGCLETLASASAIAAAAAQVVSSGVSTSLRDACAEDPSRLTAAMVAEVARAGDQQALDVLWRAGTALGVAIANCCAALAPQLVVVGGGASAALEEMRAGIEEALSLRASFLTPPPIVRGQLGDLAGAVGAAAVALRTVKR